MRALFVAVAAMFSALAYGETSSTVRVDFATPVATTPLIGFLHGVTPAAPADELIRPLNIQYWRSAIFESLDGTATSPAAYARLRTLAPQLKVQYLISDEWGYSCCRSTIRWPFESYRVWERFVADSVGSRRQSGQAVASWEVWNEPTVPFFWAGSIEQFFETYARTYRILRKQLGPDAPIAGPGFHFYDRALLQRFLDYCLAQQLQVNILTWHENGRAPIPDVADHIDEVRSMFLQSAKYQPLRIREIHIDEYGGRKTTHSPGAMLGYLYYLEAAKVDAAAKSCWKDSKRRNECFNGSLDGLVDVDSMRPRSVWWTYKLYADGAASRVLSTTSDRAIVALASSASEATTRAQVLMGKFGPSSTTQPVDVVLENMDALGFLSKSASVTVSVKRLVPTGELPSDGPVVLREVLLPLGRKARLSIPQFALNEVYVLDIKTGRPQGD